MRSVPESVFSKLARADARTICTLSSSATLTAIVAIVRRAVERRFFRLWNASVSSDTDGSRDLGCPIDVRHFEPTIEKPPELTIVADEQHGRPDPFTFGHQQF